MNILILILSIVSLISSFGAIIFSYRMFSTLKKFLGEDNLKENILNRLDTYYEETKTATAQNKHINDFLDRMMEENKKNITSFTTRRFNPYEDTGGDLSFCLVFLNKELNGIMITSLHSRERTRIYTRNIEKGNISVELLFDEKETLKDALEKLKVKN